MLEEIYKRVVQRLEAVGMKPSRASREAGLSEDAIRNMERAVASGNGRKGVSTATIESLAPILKTTPAWLFSGGALPIPVVGTVGAGSPIEALQEDNPEEIEVPAGFEDAIAFRVRGASCEPVFVDGDVVVVRSGQPGEGEFANQFCVVETVEGNGYLKQVVEARPAPGGQGRAYTLRSPNADDLPLQNIKSARPVVMRILGGR